MSFLHKGTILLILANSGVGIISKEGNNHDSILSFHVTVFSAPVSNAPLNPPFVGGTVVTPTAPDGRSLGFSFPFPAWEKAQ